MDYDIEIRAEVAAARDFALATYKRTSDPVAQHLGMHFHRMLRTWVPGTKRQARRALAEWRTHLARTTPLRGGFQIDPSNRVIAASTPGMRVLRRRNADGTTTVRYEQYATDGTLATATEASTPGANVIAGALRTIATPAPVLA